MERSLTLLFTCIRSVLGKKSDQTPITDFCRLSNCRHWLLIFCTIHHLTSVREKNYKKKRVFKSVFLFLKSFPFQSGKRGGHHPLAHFSGIPYLFRQKDKKCLNPRWQVLVDKMIGWGKLDCGGHFHACQACSGLDFKWNHPSFWPTHIISIIRWIDAQSNILQRHPPYIQQGIIFRTLTPITDVLLGIFHFLFCV